METDSKFQHSIVDVPPEGLKVFACVSGKDFLLKGGEYPLAISKERKEEVLSTYADWIKRSRGRNSCGIYRRENEGPWMTSVPRSVKLAVNSISSRIHWRRRVFADNGMELPKDYLVKSTAISFAFKDPASTAKALTDATKGNEYR